MVGALRVFETGPLPNAYLRLATSCPCGYNFKPAQEKGSETVQSDGANIRSERPQGPLTDIERSEFYLREGERLAHMGSWSLRPDGIFDYWSPETFAIFDFDPSQ